MNFGSQGLKLPSHDVIIPPSPYDKRYQLMGCTTMVGRGWGGNGGLTLEAECVGLGPCGELHHLLGVVLELLLQLWAAVGLERASGRMNTRRTHIQ